MRRLIPLGLVATVVAAFIVAKGCLPKRNPGTKALSPNAAGLRSGPAPLGDPAPVPAPPR